MTQGGGKRIQSKGEILIPNKKGARKIPGACLFIQVGWNFNKPYLCNSITDFWRRWHITLSTLFRDYVYIPLGGSKEGEIKTYYNLIITMTVAGLWHGSSWNFVLWGLIHGLLLCLEKLNFFLKLNNFLPNIFLIFLTCFIVFNKLFNSHSTA